MIGGTCLLDTGPLVALLDQNDRHHKQAVQLFAAVRPPLLTCEAVLTEACHLLQKIGPRAVRAVLLLEDKGVYKIPSTLRDTFESVIALMDQYQDLPMSLADAHLVAIATEFICPRILTFDAHFEVYRWGKQKTFEIVR